ncbi:dynein axonemal assembly factor 3-like, partial [Gracilinanus agilis]|uniref:dynein axonemal assembly factor 3-like n=1 Tax=Gracilinanus agilis TaxID=191870 RepID=UPI001CFEC36A
PAPISYPSLPQSAGEISLHNVSSLFRTLVGAREEVSGAEPEAEAEGATPESEPASSRPFRVHFLPLGAAPTLHHRSRFCSRFHLLYVSCGMVHQLSPELGACVAPGGRLVVELARYLVDLRAKQLESFSDRVRELAEAAGFVAEPREGPPETFARFSRKPQPVGDALQPQDGPDLGVKAKAPPLDGMTPPSETLSPPPEASEPAPPEILSSSSNADAAIVLVPPPEASEPAPSGIRRPAESPDAAGMLSPPLGAVTPPPENLSQPIDAEIGPPGMLTPPPADPTPAPSGIPSPALGPEDSGKLSPPPGGPGQPSATRL